MNEKPPLDQIQERRREIAREIARHETLIGELRAEDSEMKIAERVWLRLNNKGPDTANLFASESDALTGDTSERGKPDDAPTMPKMIIEALEVDDFMGAGEGLEPAEIAKYIAKKWWPDVNPGAVGPIAWRMWKRGQLMKSDSRYRLPSKRLDETASGGSNIGNPMKVVTS